MGNIKLLVLIIAAFGLTNGKRMFRKCTFCRYFYATGHSPYELLWILADEISAYLSEDQRITLFLDEEDLIKAELVFETYCEKTCNKNSLPVTSEAVAEAAATGPRRASRQHNEAFYEPRDSEISPEFTTPDLRTLFKGVKIFPPNKKPSSAGRGETTREETSSDERERAWGKEFLKHSGEYEKSGTLASSGSSGVNSGSAETGMFRPGSGKETASDEDDAVVTYSE